MSLIINQILPFISLLEIDRVIDILWYFLLLLDAIVYSVVVYVYNIFQIVAQLNFSVISSWTQPLVNRIEALIMVLILFKLGMSFIQYMITPEKFNDKATGGSALLINIVICSVLLVSYQFIFTVFNELSMLIIGYQDGYEFTVLKQIADVESENGGDEAGLLGRFIFGEKFESKNFGKQLAAITLFSFFDDKVNNRSDDALAKIYKQSSDEVNFFEITNIADAIYRDSNDEEIANHGSTEYRFPLLSTAVGIYLVYTLTVLTIEVAIRIFKLIILQITAPIAIITTIEGGTKSKTFQSFYKTYISVYTSLFLRVAVVYLVSALVSMFTQNFDTLNIGTRSSIMGGFVFVIIVVSLFTFAKKIPSFIDKALGLNSSGDGEGAAGFKGLMKSMGAAVGLGVGALGGMAAGVAAGGGVGGAVSGLFGGAYRGATGGYRANNVADFFRNQRSNVGTSFGNTLRSQANGGFLRNAALGLGAATGVNAIHNARMDREIENENNSWKTVTDNYEKDQAKYDKNINKGNEEISRLQDEMAGVDSGFKDVQGNAIAYGASADDFARRVADNDMDVRVAEANLSALKTQRGASRDKMLEAETKVKIARDKAEAAARKEFKDQEDTRGITTKRTEVKSQTELKKNSTTVYNDAKKAHEEKVEGYKKWEQKK